jgi:sec-independent protein translocase protein TatB
MLPEVGATELLVIAALALIVVGPKDLPILLRRVGQFVGRMRSMAQEFRASFDELARQSELDELRKEVEAMRAAAAMSPSQIANQAMGLQDVHSDIAAAMSGEPAPAPAAESTPPDPAPAAEAPAKPARKPRARKAKPAAPPLPEAQP